ncbi:hypothetical protein IHE61_31215 [Streptomyces sp. GKU 257-1]|nr:hypothetical protein [Streptomyces sp. GKU 257-1]
MQGASVTVQITPSSGQALTDHVKDRLDKGAPRVARETVRELVQTSPQASAQLTAWFSLIINPMTAAVKPKTPADSAAETLRVLDGVELAGTGADVLRTASDEDITRLVRGAFCPGDMDAPSDQIRGLFWHEVGPVAAEDGWDRYQHDGSLSVSWVLREAPPPRGALRRAAEAPEPRPVPTPGDHLLPHSADRRRSGRGGTGSERGRGTG